MTGASACDEMMDPRAETAIAFRVARIAQPLDTLDPLAAKSWVDCSDSLNACSHYKSRCFGTNERVAESCSRGIDLRSLECLVHCSRYRWLRQ